MALYEWRCRSCKTISTTTTYGVVPTCQICDQNNMARRYSFYARPSFQPHFNVSLGRYVRNQTEFNDGLKAAGEAATLRTGILHDYQPMEVGDSDGFGITEEATETYKELHYNEPVETRL